MSSFTVVRNIGEEHIVQLLVTKEGEGIAMLDPKLEIRRLSDGKYLNHSAVSAPYWITVGGTKQISMNSVSWSPGLYKYKFKPFELGERSSDDYDCLISVIDDDYPLYRIEHLIYVPKRFVQWDFI